MEINDSVYGKVKVDEKVILKLILSKPVQRLKGINQSGGVGLVRPEKKSTRYEHTVGVMILLRKLGASVEEQIAGLLHDVPHTAFSHTIDFALKNKDHEFHEGFHEKIINNSEIPGILKEFGYDVKRITNEKNFSLLERKLPSLCADRIDYTLRDMVNYESVSKANYYLNHLIVHENEIIFDDKKAAFDFANDYIYMDESHWANIIDISVMYKLGEAIKIALDKGILSKEDIFKDDDFVFSKLKNSGDIEITKKLDMLNPKLKIVSNPDDYDFFARTKTRFVNPKFLCSNGEVKQTTDEYPELNKLIEKHKEKTEKGHFVKIVSY